jgi:hypothetical protein
MVLSKDAPVKPETVNISGSSVGGGRVKHTLQKCRLSCAEESGYDCQRHLVVRGYFVVAGITPLGLRFHESTAIYPKPSRVRIEK